MDTERPPLLRVRDVAVAAIRSAKKPIGSKEILEYARKSGMAMLFKGETPRQSIQAAVWKDIKNNGTKSPFVMVGPGRNTRKYWLRQEWLRSARHLTVVRDGDQLRGMWVLKGSGRSK